MRGRDREIAVVLDMIRAAQTGRGGVLLVEDEPAVGKGPLLPEFSAASAGHLSSGSTAGARACPEFIAPDDLPCAARMMLAPLDDDATAQLIADELSAAPEQDLLELAAGPGGDPLLLAELLAGLRDEGGIRIDHGSASRTSAQLPQRLRTAARRWLAALSPRTRQFLAAGAVLGRSRQLGNAAALLGEAPVVLLPERRAALAAGAA